MRSAMTRRTPSKRDDLASGHVGHGGGRRQWRGGSHRHGCGSGSGGCGGYVLFDDAAAGAGADYTREINAEFAGHALGQRRGLDASTGGRRRGDGCGGYGRGCWSSRGRRWRGGRGDRRRGRWRRCGRRGRGCGGSGRWVGILGRWGFAGFQNPRQQALNLNQIAGSGGDAAQDAGSRGFDAGVDLVGFEFQDFLALLDLGAFLNQPLGDGAFFHGHAH